MDIKGHNNDPLIAIRELRNWLNTSSDRISMPGYNILVQEYNIFLQTFPQIVANLGLEINDVPFSDYCLIVEEAIKKLIGF